MYRRRGSVLCSVMSLSQRLPSARWRGISAAVALTVSATLGAQVAPRPATAQLTESARPGQTVLKRPNEASALITARLTGKQVLITGATSETSQSWALPSGQVRVQVHAGPVRVRTSDGWTDVDLTLVRAADGSVAPKAHPIGLRLSGGAAGRDGHELVALGSKIRRSAVMWPGMLPQPRLDGARATYVEVRPGVDLVVEATRSGYESLLIVKTPAAVPQVRSLTLALSGRGVRFGRDGRGGLRVTDAKTGRRVGESPAPVMWDTRTLDKSGLPVRTTVVASTVSGGSDGRARLTLSPDPGWLADPETVFPVTIDPQESWSSTFDTYVQSNLSTDQSAATDLRLGYSDDPSARTARSFLTWPTAMVAGRQVTEAKLHLWNWLSWSCTPAAWQVWTTGQASAASLWGAQPEWLHLESTSSETLGADSTCGDGWVSADATSFFQRAANTGAGSAYMGLRAAEADETDHNTWKRFNSVEAGSNIPYVTVTYNAAPTVVNRSTNPTLECASGTGRPYVNTVTPRLKAQVSDPEGSAVTAQFQWWPLDDSSVVSSVTSEAFPSGTWKSVGVLAGTMQEGVSYRWTVRGHDGLDYGPWSSRTCEFTVDTTAPVSPAVASDDYPVGAWAGGAGTAGVFTLSAAESTDVAAYLYGLDVNPPIRTVNASTIGGSVTVSITPPSDGPHTLYVQARDRAGNLSPIQSYTFNAGNANTGAVTAPSPGAITASHVPVISEAPASATGATYQWRRGDTDTWTTIPAAHVTSAVGGAAIIWPVSSTGAGKFPKLNWDVKATLAAADGQGIPRDGPVQIRGVYNTSVNPSAEVQITFDRDQSSATASGIGPGSVNLLTGNYSISQSDVSVAADGGGLGVARTFNTRQAGHSDPLFGPGWTSGLIGVDANLAYTKLDVHGSVVEVGLPDGTTLGFARKTTAAGEATFEAQTDTGTLTLTYIAASGTYLLTERAGGTVTFTRQTGDPAGQYVPVSAVTAGFPKTVTYSWERVTVNGAVVVRPTRMLAPMPAGVASCTTLVRGCRALSFSYAATTTATGTTETGWGDYTGRVKEISFTAWDPDLATPTMRTVVMASFAYDNNGRLRAVWDPRLDFTDTGVNPPVQRSLRIIYDYNADGILSGLAPAGQEAWRFTYTTVPGDAGKGRLYQLSRSALAAGTATQTVVYGVPVTGTGAPYDLAATQTGRWGQAEAPVNATAVFPASQIPSGNPANGTMPSSWERAVVTYLDSDARAVNTVQPGGYIDATVYDMCGNVVAHLSAANRARALDASASDSSAVEAQLAAALSEVRVYTADGARLTETFGPEHDVALPDGNTVRGREHTRAVYDQGAPETGGPYDLVTTETTTVHYRAGTGAEIDADARTTTTVYDWSLGQPTTVTGDPGGLNLIWKTVFDDDGRVFDRTTPGAEGATDTPYTLRTIYYTTAANATYPNCGEHPEWNGLPCRSQPRGDSPASAPLVVSLATYDMYQQRRTVIEKTKDNVQLRTTTISYDGAGRPYGTTIVSSAGLSEPLPTVRQVYDPATGQAVRTQSVDDSGAVTAQIVRGYDSLGRPTSYTDAENNTSTTGYDLQGRPVSSNDGKGTQTVTLDGGSERRGLPTQLVDSQAGTFTVQYDADGKPLKQTWPNGITVAMTSDEVGNTTGITYNKPGCGAADCTLFTETVGISVHGQRLAGWSTLSAQNFSYDKAGRLVKVNDNVGDVCNTRAYTYSAATNRTGMTSYGPGTAGACQQTTVQSTRTWTYDNTDRLTAAGTIYDQLGRTTTVPAADTVGASGAVSSQYYVNDMVHQISQGGVITIYTLDPMTNRIRTTQTGTAIKTNHYVADTDRPAWVNQGDGRYLRTVPGLAGVAGIYSGAATGIQWQITNLHGDFVATVVDGQPGLFAVHETDEQGQRRDPSQPQRGYGWLGAAQRAADNPGDLITMGVRLYNPATGRFLSADPVFGGNANNYEYCVGDTVNCTDTSGQVSCSLYVFRTIATLFGKAMMHAFRASCKLSNRETIAVIGLTALVGAAAAFVGAVLAVIPAVAAIGAALNIASRLLAFIAGAMGVAYAWKCKGKGIWINVMGVEHRISYWSSRWVLDYLAPTGSIGCR